MSTLLAIKHPNLLQYIGHALTKERGEWNLLVLLEYIDGNNLGQILYDQNLKQKLNVTQSAKTRILMRLALALAHLHDSQRQIVHGDVKPTNVMISRFKKVKLCDMGMTKIKHYSMLFFQRSLIAHGSPAYMAPEQLMEGKEPSTHTDVYAFGLTMYEVLYEDPICEEENLEDLMKRLRSEDIPAKLKKKQDDLHYSLMQQCLQREPSSRPDAQQIVSRITAISLHMNIKPIMLP